MTLILKNDLGTIRYSIPCLIVDALLGKIRFTVPLAYTLIPGLFFGQFIVDYRVLPNAIPGCFFGYGFFSDDYFGSGFFGSSVIVDSVASIANFFGDGFFPNDFFGESFDGIVAVPKNDIHTFPSSGYVQIKIEAAL